MLDLSPIKERLGSEIYRNTHPDLAALVAEVERLRAALDYEIETVGKCGEEIERLRTAIEKHRDGWYRSENNMLVDRVVKRAAQARELWAALNS